MASRKFPLNVVVNTITGRNVAPFPDYRAFLNYLTGQDVPLWDVEKVRKLAAKWLIGNYKALKRLPPLPEKTDSGNAGKYIKECAAAVGYDHVTVVGNAIKYTPRRLDQAYR